MGEFLARPVMALASVTLGLSLGIGFAHERARDTNGQSWKKLEARYTVSIDPLAMHSGVESAPQ
jgi:hypothetical protein